SKLGTKLKVMGVELASMGETKPASPDDEVVVYREPKRGVYKKLIIRNEKIAGAILLGDIDAAQELLQMFYNETKVPERRHELLFGAPSEELSSVKVVSMPDSVQICNCNGITKGQILNAIRSGCS